MTLTWRQDGVWFGLAAACAAVAGGLLLVRPTLALALVPLTVVAAALVARPTWSLPFMFASLLVSDAAFLTPYTVVIIVPITVGKLATLMTLGLWFVHCMIYGKWPLRLNKLWLPLGAACVVFALGCLQLRSLSYGLDLVIGFGLLMTLCQVLDAIAEVRHLRASLDVIAWLYVALVGASLFLGFSTSDSVLSRFSGFSMNANEWSLTVLVGLGPVVAVFETMRSRWGRVGSVAAIAVAIVAIVLSVSRSGLVMLALMAPLLVLITGRRSWIWLVLGSVAVGSVLDLSAVFERFDSFVDATELEMDGSIRERALAGRFAVEAWTSSPWIGIGTDAFNDESVIMSGGQIDLSTHNTYLQVLAEWGLAGAAVLLWIPVTIVRLLWSMWQRQSSPAFRKLVLGFAASTLCFFALIFTINAITFAMPFFFLALMAVLERASRLSQDELSQCGLG